MIKVRVRYEFLVAADDQDMQGERCPTARMDGRTPGLNVSSATFSGLRGLGFRVACMVREEKERAVPFFLQE